MHHHYHHPYIIHTHTHTHTHTDHPAIIIPATETEPSFTLTYPQLQENVERVGKQLIPLLPGGKEEQVCLFVYVCV
jgi:hypothetical protein